jgi:hypothetical protein
VAYRLVVIDQQLPFLAPPMGDKHLRVNGQRSLHAAFRKEPRLYLVLGGGGVG